MKRFRPTLRAIIRCLGLVYEESNQLALANTAYKKGLQFKANPCPILSPCHILRYPVKTSLVMPLKYYNLYLKSKPDVKGRQGRN